jgi:radical SAM protein with 4Fe4S-binding SPASM domain
MDFELFCRLVDQIRDENLTSVVHLYGVGESYVIPEHIMYFNYAIPALRPFCATTIITNAGLLDHIPYGITNFLISFNAGRKETYERKMGLDFERTLDNIDRIFQTGEYLIPQNMQIHMLVDKENVEEMTDFAALFSKYPVVLRYGFKYDNQHGLVPDLTVPQFRTEQRFPCHYVREVMNIGWDGRVLLCPHDFDAEVVYGDASKEKIIDIWESNAHKKIATEHLRNKYNGLCKDCNYNISGMTGVPDENPVKYFYFWGPSLAGKVVRLGEYEKFYERC